MKTKIRMMESNGSGGESWDGVLKLPIDLSAASTSVYREICEFAELGLHEFLPEFLLGEPRASGDGVGIFTHRPFGHRGLPVPGLR